MRSFAYGLALFTLASALPTSGYGQEVLECHALLNPDSRKAARPALVAAFAASSIGLYHDAKAYLATALMGADKLSQEDRQFLDYLHLGRFHDGWRVVNVLWTRV